MTILFTCKNCQAEEQVELRIERRYYDHRAVPYSVRLSECYLPDGWDIDICPTCRPICKKIEDAKKETEDQLAEKAFNRELDGLSLDVLFFQLARHLSEPSVPFRIMQAIARKVKAI